MVLLWPPDKSRAPPRSNPKLPQEKQRYIFFFQDKDGWARFATKKRIAWFWENPGDLQGINKKGATEKQREREGRGGEAENVKNGQKGFKKSMEKLTNNNGACKGWKKGTERDWWVSDIIGTSGGGGGGGYANGLVLPLRFLHPLCWLIHSPIQHITIQYNIITRNNFRKLN